MAATLDGSCRCGAVRFKPAWVEVERGPDDLTLDLYPEQSFEDWHRAHGLWVD